MPLKLIFNYKSLLLTGLALNIFIIIYIYFIVDGGPVSVQQGGDWMAILNEVPMTILFFLAGVFKPYLMVWSRCRKNFDVISLAGTLMLTTTLIAFFIIIYSEKALTKDLALYLNWALLWGASAYFVLTPQRISSSE